VTPPDDGAAPGGLRALLGRLGRRATDAVAGDEGQIVAPSDRPLDEHRRQIIDRVLHLDEARAWDVMTPRVDVFAWPARLTLAEIAPQLGTVRYSRIPVYGDTIDDVVGVLYVRDAYGALISGQRDVPLGELAREPFLVPGSIPLMKLLRDFQARRIHLGVVIDEYGGTDGLVTLEDILEEMVGEIVDETDVEEQPIVRVGRNEVAVEGYADLREINHFFNTSFPQLEHRSFNGYVLDELGHVPRAGDELVREGIRIRIVDASDTQVLRAHLFRDHPAEDADSGDADSGDANRGGPADGATSAANDGKKRSGRGAH
jgi:CBS domain containing-hemolysin-like protein